VKHQPLVIYVALGAVGLALAGCEQKSADRSVASPSPSAESTKTPDNVAAESSVTPTPTQSPTAAPMVSPSANEPPSLVSPTPSTAPATAAIVRPQFKDEEANQYLDDYDAYLDEFRSAYLEMQNGNMAKFQSMIDRAKEMQNKGEAVQAKLSPEEQKAFQEYIGKKSEQLGNLSGE
jgi:hypothetical protein